MEKLSTMFKNYTKISSLIIIILWSLSCNDLLAQMEGKPVLELPEKYIKVSNYRDISPGQENVITGRPWVVMTDRGACKTYKKPTQSGYLTAVGFMEDFYVIGETDKDLHIVKDDNLDYSDLTLSSSAKDYGWISKKNLLLSRSCLATNKGKIDKKIMLLNTVEAAKERQVKKVEDNSVVFYKDPSLKTRTDNRSTIFEIFYLYKIEGEAFLVGRRNQLSPNINNRENITGWINRKRAVVWNHRIAIEPNWTEQAVDERMNKGVKAKIFLDEKQALNYSENPQKQQNAFFINNDRELKDIGRYPGEWRRFPLYKSKLTGVTHVGTIGRLVADNGSMNTLGKARVDSKVTDLQQAKRNVNIMFVVDGSSSMGPYFQAVSNSIRRTMNNLTNSMGTFTTLNKIKFGAVVYRDYAEGDRKIEVYPLTTKYQDIAYRLARVEARDWEDTDKPEAVFYGIQKAIRQFPNKFQTNVIILIGDAGNHHRNDITQVEQQTIVKLLAGYQCNFLVFQVQNDAAYETYNEFVTQSCNIIETTAGILYRRLKPHDYKNKLGKPPELLFTGENKKAIPINRGAIQASITYAPVGGSLSPKQLEKEIPKLISNIDNNTNDLIVLVSELIEQGAGIKTVADENKTTIYSKRKASDFAPALINFLIQSGLSSDEIETMMENKYQMFKDGFTTLELKQLKYPLFRRVVLLTRLELSTVIQDIQKLANSGAGTRRLQMQNTWKELLKRYIGNVSNEELMNMGMDKINKMLFDVPTNSTFLKKKALRDITNPRAFPDTEFERYVSKLERKAERLSSIFNQEKYPYSFISNSIYYYWIPETMLP